MDPLSITASIIAILQLTAKVGDCLRDAKDATTDCEQFTAEIKNLSNLLVALLSRVDESSQEPWHIEVSNLGSKDGIIYQYRIALEQLKDKVMVGHGGRKLAKILLWKYVKEDAAHILLKVERLKSLVQIAIQMDHLELSKANQSLFSSMHDSSQVIQTGVLALQTYQDRSRHLATMEWLSSADFPAQQWDHMQRREEETGIWFLNAPQFKDWIDGSDPVLFCPGIPGAGKTMMAAIVVDHLQKTIQNPEIGVSYLYCSYKRQEQQSTASLLAAILKQLVQDKFSIAKPVTMLYDKHEIGKTRPSADELFDVLKIVIKSYTKTYLVLDALDECADQELDRTQLLKLCFMLQQDTNLKLMATSRKISDIVDKFTGKPQLEVRADTADVKLYVKGQIARLPKCIQGDTDLQVRIADKIAEVIDGMFLLARLHVDSLLDKRTKAKVMRMLESLSKGTKGSIALEAAYHKAIVRIESQLPEDVTLAKSVLAWLSYAQRPLTVLELCHALAVEIGHDELDSDNISDIDDIVSVCAGLVTVDEETQIIRLVHYTTQEYLETTRKAWIPQAQTEIAATCLTYLCLEPFRSGPCSSMVEWNARLENYPFLTYSTKYWGRHAADVQHEICNMAICLFREGSLTDWVHQTRSGARRWPRRSLGNLIRYHPKGVTALHIAAEKGLACLCEEILRLEGEKPSFVNSKTSHGETALTLAAGGGHKSVVKLLLRLDHVRVNHGHGSYHCPLIEAAESGHDDIVELLLDTGKVDINATDGFGNTALHKAVSEGHKEVVKLLMNANNIDADLRNDFGETLLMGASLWGRKNIVKLLLETGKVDINAKNEEGETALTLAAKEGYENIVKLLLDSDKVDVSVKTNLGTTAFISAAENGREEIVKLLLETGKVDVNAKDNNGVTALMFAVGEELEETVKLLLDSDKVDVNAKNVYGGTALTEAVQMGHEKVVSILLGVDGIIVDLDDHMLIEALDEAVGEGREDIVNLVKSHVANYKTAT